MNHLTRTFLLVAVAFSAFGQGPTAPQPDPPAATSADPNWLLTTGIGYKPYQTTIKAGSSAYLEGGKAISSGIYAFTRLDARSTDAQLIVEGCKTLFSSVNVLPMLCGGPGFGADANNIGIALSGGFKFHYRVTKFRGRSLGDNTWIQFVVNVDKNTVPAPVAPDPKTPAISPVQPSFRFGISKSW